MGTTVGTNHVIVIQMGAAFSMTHKNYERYMVGVAKGYTVTPQMYGKRLGVGSVTDITDITPEQARDIVISLNETKTGAK